MNENNNTWLRIKSGIIIIGLIASFIGIITFLSGKQNINAFLQPTSARKIDVIADAISQPMLEEKGNNIQPIIIVVTREQEPINNNEQSNSSPKNNNDKSPLQFIRDYYSNINTKNYENAWSMLSSRFKNTYNKTGYQPYVNWWNTVKYVEINSAHIDIQDLNSAIISVELVYYYQNGQIDTNDLSSFSLVYNSDLNEWQIDDCQLIKGTR